MLKDGMPGSRKRGVKSNPKVSEQPWKDGISIYRDEENCGKGRFGRKD